MSKVLKEMFLNEIEVQNDPGDRWWDFVEKLIQLLGQYPELEAQLSPDTREAWDEGRADPGAVLTEISTAIFSNRDPDAHLPSKGN